ncbi:hypothetical protein, partial [Candidatus Amarolinea dominans]|uniref:hypothetical protein n=1 Tax=Candidatus Amarolinea dominans TaxID=3140696 RepID=UPI003136E4E7|nr:hypothetical protein [Anaerolineae bacterium]
MTLAQLRWPEGSNSGFTPGATSADGVYQRMTSAPSPARRLEGAAPATSGIDESAVAGKAYFYRSRRCPSGQMIGPVPARPWGMQI